MKFFAKIISAVTALSLLSSCAYLFNDKNVAVAIDSNPKGADIVIDGKNYGQTPATISLEPKNYTVLLIKEGYGSTQMQLESWQAVRTKNGEGGRCLADALGSVLVLPMLSYWSVYCRDFKQPSYSANIPYLGGGAAPQNSRQYAPQQMPQQQGDYNYYQPYSYGSAPQQGQQSY